MFPLLGVFYGCASAVQPIPERWLSLPPASTISPEQLRRAVAETAPLARAEAPVASEAAVVRIVTSDDGARLFNGETPLTPPYRAIDSFDVSADRGEVVFSAKRDRSFDIGLVALEGGNINWIPEEPSDEVSPRWAPRGNKVSYIIRHRRGDLIRTVHIPTAFQLIVDFPFGLVRDLAWDPAAERFAVSWESVDASQRVEVLRYGGEERRLAFPPAVKLDVEVAPFAGGVLMRPSASRYNERLPLVVWVRPGELNAWDEARGVLMQKGRMAALVVDAPPGAELLRAIDESAWIDRSAIFVVDATGTSEPLAGTTLITADGSLRAGHYRRSANVVAVHPAVVQSFAAGYLGEKLKIEN